MIEMGIVVALGLFVMYIKMSWRGRMWVNSNPLTVDVMVFVGLTALHWGTFSGVMVAAVGALFCSLTISAARYFVGYITKGVYTPGVMDVSAKL